MESGKEIRESKYSHDKVLSQSPTAVVGSSTLFCVGLKVHLGSTERDLSLLVNLFRSAGASLLEKEFKYP